MASAQTTDGGADDGEPGCARDFAVERLREADSPATPSELAEGYGCTNGHMRNVLRSLRRDGRVERVGHGKYTLREGESADTEAEVGPDAAESGAEGEPPEYEQMDTDPSAVEGEGSEGAEGDETGEQEGEVVPSDEELERQRELVVGSVEEVQDDSESGGEESVVESVEDGHRPADELGRTFPEEESAGGEGESDPDGGVVVDDPDDDPSRGVPIPVSSNKLVAGAVLFLALGLLYARWKSQQEAVQREEQTSEPEPAVQSSSGGGLVSEGGS